MKVGDLVECTNTGSFGIILEVHYSESAVHPYFIYWVETGQNRWCRPEALKLADKNETRRPSICVGQDGISDSI